MRRSRFSLRSWIIAAVPSVAGWRTFPRALANLLLFALAALAGTWVVHQVAYRIEYGDRFAAVMATTPHRYYMGTAGLLLAGTTGLLLGLIVYTIEVARAKRLRFLGGLPRRLSRYGDVSVQWAPFSTLVRTALALSSVQMALYLVQENLEYVVAGRGWPGLSVLIAPEHAIVVPLHLLAALCGALILWAISARMSHSRRADHVVRVLLGIAARGGTARPRLVASRHHIPDLRLIAGVLCLRSPPLAA